MKKLLLGVVGFALLGLGQLPPSVAPAEVLTYLQTMAISPELKNSFAPLLSAALTTGRATCSVSLNFLRQLSARPPAEAEECILVIRAALEQGFIVDTGTGSSLMNQVLKLLQLKLAWDQLIADVKIRYNLMVATRTVLGRYGAVERTSLQVGEPVLPQDRLVLELAWAVGDYLGQDPVAVEAQVRGRLVNLRGTVLPPSTVDPVLQVLDVEMVQAITVLAFTLQRR